MPKKINTGSYTELSSAIMMIIAEAAKVELAAVDGKDRFSDLNVEAIDISIDVDEMFGCDVVEYDDTTTITEFVNSVAGCLGIAPPESVVPAATESEYIRMLKNPSEVWGFLGISNRVKTGGMIAI